MTELHRDEAQVCIKSKPTKAFLISLRGFWFWFGINDDISIKDLCWVTSGIDCWDQLHLSQSQMDKQ